MNDKGGAVTERGFSRRSILCVGDVADSRAVLEEGLAGHELVFASTAFEAISEINKRGFNGYILEYWLTDWSGPSLCRHIRKLDPHPPIVFCAPSWKDDQRGRALRAGGNAFLTKPLDPEALRAKLEPLLSMAEVDSLKARALEELAIQEELERRVAELRERASGANALAAASMERTARIKAMKAFIEARGSRAHFERWWPQVFQCTRATHSESSDDTAAA
jgi:CheY-like chemotaxis protein